MSQTVTVLFATDAGYVPHLATAIYSLLKNNQSLNLRIIVFTAGLPKADRVNLAKVSSEFGVPLSFHILDDIHFDGLVLNSHFQKSNYYRLFAADFLQEESCLYLDADIIVNGSIKDLIEINLEDYYLAAVENPNFSRHKELGMRSESKYFNSGVMLLNLDKWRQSGMKDAVISLVKAKPEAIHFVDQCGLNGIVDGKWLELGAKFNFQSSMITRCSDEKKAIVIHFTGSSKPWHLSNKHPYKSLYWKYRNSTPYKSYLPDDLNLRGVSRYLLPAPIKKIIKHLIGNITK